MSQAIMSHVERRESRRSMRSQVRRIRHDLRRQVMRYGATPAEVQSRRVLITATRQRVRELVMGAKGRRIDLLALLKERRRGGQPLWALADPLCKLGEHNNGQCVGGHEYRVAAMSSWQWKYARRRTGHEELSWTYETVYVGSKPAQTVSFTPAAIPPLPRKARRIVQDMSVRRRASWVGLLYQPEEWMEAKPDPAIVVEWIDRPGEYYCLAVWGGDMPRIMEFVD